MNAIQLNQNETAPFLTVVNNSLNKLNAETSQAKRIYINTLIPGFSYINSTGEAITQKICALL